MFLHIAGTGVAFNMFMNVECCWQFILNSRGKPVKEETNETTSQSKYTTCTIQFDVQKLMQSCLVIENILQGICN